MNDIKHIYIVISQTETGFAKRIRKYGHVKYNHASIALDKELTQMYGFARTEQYGTLVATLVKETTDRLTVNAPDGIGIAVFDIPVTIEQYNWVKEEIDRIMQDPSIRYNLFSVLTYPMFKGFSSKKSFTCIEFIMYVLKGLGAHLDEPIAKYRPDQLLEFLDKYLVFEGNLLDYTSVYTRSEDYFSPVSFKLIRASVKAFVIISYRSLGTFGRYIKKKIVA